MADWRTYEVVVMFMQVTLCPKMMFKKVSVMMLHDVQ